MSELIAVSTKLTIAEKLRRYGLRIIMYLLLGVTALTVLLPLIWISISSFRASGAIVNFPFGGPFMLRLENFADAWNKANMGSYFLNTLMLTGGSLALLLVLAVPAAYVLARFKHVLLKIVAFVFLAGLFVNVNYIVTPLYVMIFEISVALGMRGLLAGNMVTVIVIYAVTNFSFSVYLLTGFFSTLPRGYEEAAKIDGCGYYKTLIRVCVPLATPSIMTVIMFNFLAFWNEFIVANMFLPTAQFPLSVGLLQIMRQSKQYLDLGRLYAGLMIVMVPVLLVYIFVQGQLTKGISLGGLKG